MSIGFLALLAVAFIVLKLCAVVAWPWAWVLAPLWIPGALIALAAGAVLVAGLVGIFFAGVTERRLTERGRRSRCAWAGRRGVPCTDARKVEDRP